MLEKGGCDEKNVKWINIYSEIGGACFAKPFAFGFCCSSLVHVGDNFKRDREREIAARARGGDGNGYRDSGERREERGGKEQAGRRKRGASMDIVDNGARDELGGMDDRSGRRGTAWERRERKL